MGATGEGIYFMSEAKLGQTLGFIEAGLASLARLQATASAAALDLRTRQEFATLTATSISLRAQLARDLQPLLAADGPIADARAVAGQAFGVDPAVQRLIGATSRVLERLDEMIAKLQAVQLQPDQEIGRSIQP